MNHKNFHFTQIPEKTNDVIFLKVKNPVFGPFLTIFGHFCLMVVFSKKSGSVTHNYIWAPNTMLSFRKTNEPVLRKLTDRWKDGQAYPFIGPFRPRQEVEQTKKQCITSLRCNRSNARLKTMPDL